MTIDITQLKTVTVPASALAVIGAAAIPKAASPMANGASDLSRLQTRFVEGRKGAFCLVQVIGALRRTYREKIRGTILHFRDIELV